MSANELVIQWYGDQIAAIIETCVALILFCIIIKGLYKENSDKYPTTFKVAICWVYILTIVHGTAALSVIVGLPIFKEISPSTNQQTICWGTWMFLLPAFVAMHSSIMILFISRLDISFKNSVFAVSKCTNFSFRTLYPLTMVVLLTFTGFAIKPYPYDIYNKRVDYNGNGVTCSTFVDDEPNLFLMACVALVGLCLITGNITVWLLFMKRVYQLVKQINNTGKSVDEQFITLMKEQTFIVCIAVFTTVISWGLQSVTAWGAITVPLDATVTVFVIFLSFKFNRYYFELFKCDLLTKFCCGYFERYIIKKITKDEKTMIDILQQNKTNSNLPSVVSNTAKTDIDIISVNSANSSNKLPSTTPEIIHAPTSYTIPTANTENNDVELEIHAEIK